VKAVHYMGALRWRTQLGIRETPLGVPPCGAAWTRTSDMLPCTYEPSSVTCRRCRRALAKALTEERT
jgi:hypothetical protein